MEDYKGQMVDLLLDEVNVKEARFVFYKTEKGLLELVRKKGVWEVQLNNLCIDAPKTLKILIEGIFK